MGQTVSIWTLQGTSKAKTDKAILFLDARTGKQAWLPTSVTSIRFIDRNFGVKVTLPGWFVNKIQWKDPSEFANRESKPKNPYVGSDVGNMLEEKMVLEEMYGSTTDQNEKTKLLKKIKLIEEAIEISNRGN